MEALWFAILAVMFAIYVVLDGFDFGAGILHTTVARSDAERRTVLQAIGPVWDANEVWLVSSGGLLFFAFPRVYAAAFSGFYMPLIIVLWLLVGRGLAIDWRSHHDNPLWRAFGDAAFAVSGWLLAIVLGAALGNLIRGVPLEPNGYFWVPLWTDFRTGPRIGILDWYTITVAAFTFFVLAGHGALYLVWKTNGAVRERAADAAGRLWPMIVLFGIAATVTTAAVRPDLYRNIGARPWSWPIVACILAGIAGAFAFRRAGREREAFLSSALFIAALLGATAAGIYPEILHSTLDPAHSLGPHNSAAGAHGLRVGIVWWCIAMPPVIYYFIRLFRSFGGKVRPEDEGY